MAVMCVFTEVELNMAADIILAYSKGKAVPLQAQRVPGG
jgi:hypothetical protein